MNRIYIKQDELIRFWSKVQVLENGCWQWTASQQGTGYGQFYVGGTRNMLNAHVYAYETLKGQIPAGLEIDHLCRNRLCVNPAHLEAVTPRINCLRGLSPLAKHAAKTHCLRGHPFEGPNLKITKNGHRKCRICNNWGRDQKRKAIALKEENEENLWWAWWWHDQQLRLEEECRKIEP